MGAGDPAYQANEAAKETASKAKMRAENLAYRANEASKIKDDTNTIMRKATTITNLTRIAHICGYREQLPGILLYQHGILKRWGRRLASVRSLRSRLALVQTEYQRRGE